MHIYVHTYTETLRQSHSTDRHIHTQRREKIHHLTAYIIKGSQDRCKPRQGLAGWRDHKETEASRLASPGWPNLLNCMVQAHLPRDSTVRSGMDINLQLRESLRDMPQSGGAIGQLRLPLPRSVRLTTIFLFPPQHRLWRHCVSFPHLLISITG